MENQLNYFDKLRMLMKEFVHGVYDATEGFPKSEIFGSVSQVRRASLSVLLNFTEGFARKRSAVMKNFYEISYGSLKETLIILEFALERKYIKKDIYDKLNRTGDEIGRMLWSCIIKIK